MADLLAPSPLHPALAGCRGTSAGCCACLPRLSRSSHRRRLHTDRLAFTNHAATPDASSKGRLGASLPAPRLCGLHHRSIFAVIARTTPTTTPRVQIYVPSSRTWRVLRHRRSDQPIWCMSSPSTSPSTRLPLFEHRAATVSSLWAVASPPLLPPPATNVPSLACMSLVVLMSLHRLTACSCAVPSGRSIAARGRHCHLTRTSQAASTPPSVHGLCRAAGVVPHLIRTLPLHQHR
jgi:hypothetical protein